MQIKMLLFAVFKVIICTPFEIITKFMFVHNQEVKNILKAMKLKHTVHTACIGSYMNLYKTKTC
jgi:hypothetical protein